MVVKQKTLAKEVSIKGTGLHSGVITTLKLKPSEANTGYTFIRTDLEGSPSIKAISDNVTDTARGTTLTENNASIMTMEHLLSACYALEIDNVTFEIDGPEIPILDGSSRFFVEALYKAGTKDLDEDRIVYDIKHNLCFVDKQRNIEIKVFPYHDYAINTLVDYNTTAISNQYATLDNIKDFKKEISNCRTFVFLSELEPLLNLNLIKGGDLDNAIVIVDKKTTQKEFDKLTEIFNKPRIEAQSIGILNNVKLRYNNEPARHKLLDIIGDLALTGFRFNGYVVAKKPGHFGNTQMAKIIRKHIIKHYNL